MANDVMTQSASKEENSEKPGDAAVNDGWRWVGLDLHKKECQLAIVTSQGVQLDQRIKTARDTFEEVFGGRPRMKILLEAGTESEWVAQSLEGLGHEVLVADPNFAPMYATRTRKIKTDKRDAHALVDALRAGTYRLAHRCSAQQRAVKEWLTVRDVMVAARTKSINTCRALLRSRGFRVESGESSTFPVRAQKLIGGDALEPVLGSLLREQNWLNGEIALLDKRLDSLAKLDEKVVRLMEVPGVGPVTALAFCAQLDNAERFDSAKQVRAYLGLVPGEDSSGEGRRMRGITKTGDGRTRRLLVQAAHSLLKSKQGPAVELQLWAQRLLLKKKRSLVVVALARKLAGILWALLVNGDRFELRADRTRMSKAA